MTDFQLRFQFRTYILRFCWKIEKGFIKAEVIGYEDYVKYNGESGAKGAGRLRLEGKEYIVQDGDIVHFRFNV